MLTYASGEDMISGLLPNQCIIKQFSTFLHQIKIYNLKWFDLSSLSGMDMSLQLRRFTLFFENTIPMPFRRNVDPTLSSGLYQHVWNQNPKIFNEQLALVTLDQLTAYLGGYVSVVYAFFYGFTMSYRYFKFDQSLIRQIYL